jgi:hypothetical protein
MKTIVNYNSINAKCLTKRYKEKPPFWTINIIFKPSIVGDIKIKVKDENEA